MVVEMVVGNMKVCRESKVEQEVTTIEIQVLYSGESMGNRLVQDL